MRKGLTVGSLIPGKTRTVASELPSHHDKTAAVAKTNANPRMVRVKQRNQEHSIPFVPGATLLDAALQQKEELAYKCQQGHCGKCTVQVISGISLLGSPTEQEWTKLGSKIAMGYRLACQTTFAPPYNDKR